MNLIVRVPWRPGVVGEEGTQLSPASSVGPPQKKGQRCSKSTSSVSEGGGRPSDPACFIHPVQIIGGQARIRAPVW